MTVPASWIPQKKKKNWKWNPLSTKHTLLYPLRDDKDGVLNTFDCQPKNKKKQGKIHEQARVIKRNGKTYIKGDPLEVPMGDDEERVFFTDEKMREYEERTPEEEEKRKKKLGIKRWDEKRKKFV